MLHIKAENLRQVDADYRAHLGAWLSMVARQEKKAGKNKTKPVYDRFSKFYDYEEALEKAGKKNIGNKGCKFPNVAKLLKKGGADNG